MKKNWKTMVALILTVILSCSSALACTSIYVGANLTSDGATYFARSEDYSNSQNKLFYVSPAGKHVAGELYNGCYGFTYTFTHDSYSYTAFSDDNQAGVEYECPDCGQTHAHTPYEAGGANEMGVMMSATETIGGCKEVSSVDPIEDLGIEEAEIVTVVLSEAATAYEGVQILLGIYDNAGCCGGSGLFIADANEIWYIENVTGHAYIAVKLSKDMVFVEPNMVIIGKIDLDDTENVIASENLIAVAQAAGTFVGDADANVIDYLASYNPGQTANARIKDALMYLNSAYDFTETAPDAELYAISNVDAEGNIVPMHTGIVLEGAFDTKDAINFYKIESIGYERNLETHIFQYYPGTEKTDIIEWVAMNDASMNVFVPYYPLLTTDVAPSYKVSTLTADFSAEQPENGIYYASTQRMWTENGPVSVEGFCVLPENWADSYYWSVDAVTNLMTFGSLSEDKVQMVNEALAAKQQEVYDAFEAMKADVAAAENPAEAATGASMAMANSVYEMFVNLAGEITK